MYGLFNVPNAAEKAQSMMGGAQSTLSSMTRNQETKTKAPGPSVGGAIGAGVGGALAGAELGGMMASVGGPAGAAVGAAVGIGAYLFS